MKIDHGMIRLFDISNKNLKVFYKCTKCCSIMQRSRMTLCIHNLSLIFHVNLYYFNTIPFTTFLRIESQFHQLLTITNF